jgi:hypothetical protein
MTAHQAAAAIQAKVTTVTKLVDVTAASDANHLLGRPNGYAAATILIDSRESSDCTESDPGVGCGVTIEQWPDESSAKSRMDYIQTILKASPMLGSEYDYVRGDLLVRVTGKLTPNEAKKIVAAV